MAQAPRFQPFQMTDPLQMVQSFYGLQKAMQEDETRRRADDDRKVFAEVAQTNPNDPDSWVTALNERGKPQLAIELQNQLIAARKTEAEATEKRLKNLQTQLERASAIASGITDEPSFQRGRLLIAQQLGPEIAQHLGDTYDPDRVKQALSWGSSESGRIQTQQQATQNYLAALRLSHDQGKDAPETMKKWTEAVGQGLSAARTPEEWGTIRQTFQQGGVPASILQMFPQEFTPDAPQLAAQLALTPEQRAQIADRDAARAETARHNAATEQAQRGQLAVAQGNLAVRQKALENQLSTAKTAADGGKFGPALTVLDEIETLALGAAGDDGKRTGGVNQFEGVTARLGGPLQRGAAAANYNNAVAEYDALINGFTPIVARALGHSGVLTEQDVRSVRALFPEPGDSRTLAQAKLQRVRDLLGKLQGGAGGAAAGGGSAAAVGGPMKIGGFEVVIED